MVIYNYSKGKEHTRVCKVKKYDVYNKKRYERCRIIKKTS